MKSTNIKKPAKSHKDQPVQDQKNKQPQKNDGTTAQKDDAAPKGLTKEDLPDATNESTGTMGSGQRQDSN